MTDDFAGTLAEDGEGSHLDGGNELQCASTGGEGEVEVEGTSSMKALVATLQKRSEGLLQKQDAFSEGFAEVSYCGTMSSESHEAIR